MKLLITSLIWMLAITNAGFAVHNYRNDANAWIVGFNIVCAIVCTRAAYDIQDRR